MLLMKIIEKKRLGKIEKKENKEEKEILFTREELGNASLFF